MHVFAILVLGSPQSHCKLRKLEIKITKTEDDVIRFRREILLEELKGSNMNSEALAKIGAFVPRLEKVYLDDVFADSNYLMDMIKLRSDNIVEAWKEMANNIMNCPIAKRKIRCLSLAGENDNVRHNCTFTHKHIVHGRS